MKILALNVSKSFGEKAVLRDVSFTVPEGGTLVLTGDSGSGKTTLLRILIGLERADAGEIRFEERAPASFGVVFQEDRLVETASAMENVRMIDKKSGRPSDDETRAALLELLPEESLKLPVSQFSGGMKRRLAVVRAMLSHGEVLVMDEPLSGLDEENREKVLAFIRKHQLNRPLVLTAHDMEDLRGYEEYRIPSL
ncbi:MAG: ABC transporter ATP-binding protein [Lachnospiraceae bacterium]|nr:ABC transporter ATP-binding protein [Lachnospiraceae bacterium]